MSENSTIRIVKYYIMQTLNTLHQYPTMHCGSDANAQFCIVNMVNVGLSIRFYFAC